jgi:phage terminase large subunit
MIISIKELSKLLGCSDKTGSRIAKEIRNYKWEQDKLTGKPINVPIDAFNHALDALRYGCMAKLGRRSFVMEQEN